MQAVALQQRIELAIASILHGAKIVGTVLCALNDGFGQRESVVGIKLLAALLYAQEPRFVGWHKTKIAHAANVDVALLVDEHHAGIDGARGVRQPRSRVGYHLQGLVGLGVND